MCLLTHSQFFMVSCSILAQVAVEIMVERSKSLDQFIRQYLAPLGIYFPFPHHCSKLDSYLRRTEELIATGVTGSLQAPALNNDKFWDEWKQIKVRDTCTLPTLVYIILSSLYANSLMFLLQDALSLNLIDLFNRIFLLTPPLRITLRDMVRHSWFSKGERMSPEDVSTAMAARLATPTNHTLTECVTHHIRCPSAISVQQGASPKVPVTKLLGGVDQVHAHTRTTIQLVNVTPGGAERSPVSTW